MFDASLSFVKKQDKHQRKTNNKEKQKTKAKVSISGCGVCQLYPSADDPVSSKPDRTVSGNRVSKTNTSNNRTETLSAIACL